MANWIYYCGCEANAGRRMHGIDVLPGEVCDRCAGRPTVGQILESDDIKDDIKQDVAVRDWVSVMKVLRFGCSCRDHEWRAAPKA